jgi:hypothetical protein
LELEDVAIVSQLSPLLLLVLQTSDNETTTPISLVLELDHIVIRSNGFMHQTANDCFSGYAVASTPTQGHGYHEWAVYAVGDNQCKDEKNEHGPAELGAQHLTAQSVDEEDTVADYSLTNHPVACMRWCPHLCGSFQGALLEWQQIQAQHNSKVQGCSCLPHGPSCHLRDFKEK